MRRVLNISCTVEKKEKEKGEMTVSHCTGRSLSLALTQQFTTHYEMIQALLVAASVLSGRMEGTKTQQIEEVCMSQNGRER